VIDVIVRQLIAAAAAAVIDSDTEALNVNALQEDIECSVALSEHVHS
jgi:hypothetical protein